MVANKRIAQVFQQLMEKGPSIGYFPEPTKLYHICPKEEEAETRVAFKEAGIEVNFCRGKCYVGSFVGSEAMLEPWLDPMVKKWVTRIKTTHTHTATRAHCPDGFRVMAKVTSYFCPLALPQDCLY